MKNIKNTVSGKMKLANPRRYCKEIFYHRCAFVNYLIPHRQAARKTTWERFPDPCSFRPTNEFLARESF